MNTVPAPFQLNLPETTPGAVVFSSPHSGRDYPQSLLEMTHLSQAALRSSEDAFVDDLFASASAAGAPFLAARFPRAYVDLNRSREDLDPALIEDVSSRTRSPRINAGLGVIPRVVSDSRAIIHGKIPLLEAKDRLRAIYDPYHAALSSLLEETRRTHGLAILMDCHSMPHDALIGSPLVNGVRPEIVLGDRFGASCGRWIMEAAIEGFTDAGFSVARNAPFAGGFITQAYGKPADGLHALQIEVDRSLYMDEKAIRKRPDFDDVQGRIGQIVHTLAQLGGNSSAIAAE